MKIPEKIKFLGHEYEVRQLPQNEIGGGCNGETWMKLHKINIDDYVPQSRKESVLLHEIIEIVNCQFGLELDHWKIGCLEETLYATLKENKLNYGDDSNAIKKG